MVVVSDQQHMGHLFSPHTKPYVRDTSCPGATTLEVPDGCA
jgi:hypothetical protein